MNRIGLWAAALAFAASVVRPAAAEEPPSLNQVRAAAGAGRHDEVVAATAKALAALAADPAANGWSMDFGKAPVEDARVGARYLYLRNMTSAGRERIVGPDLPIDPRHEPPDAENYGSLPTVTCVDAATGRPLWSRRFLPPLRMAVDPRDDALWTWNRAPGSPILRIDPATGDEAVRGQMPAPAKAAEGRRGRRTPEPPTSIDGPRGLRVDGLRLWDLATPNVRDLAVDLELDIAGGRIDRAFDPARLSPNRLRVLTTMVSQPSSKVLLVPALADTVAPAEWFYQAHGIVGAPAWIGGDVLVPAGHPESYGAAIRLDRKTGRPKWIHVLPEPAADPMMSQIRNGSYPPGGWSPIGPLADKVAALGARGTVFLLDPETGDEVGRVTTGSPLLAFPRVDGGRLILAGTDGVRALPTATVPGLGSGPDPWAELNALRARSLLALGRTTEALEVAGSMARSRLDSAEAWALLADAREAVKADPVAPRVAAMAASGAEEDGRLRESHGLLARIPTAPVSAAPVAAGPLALVGCRDGRLLTVDVRGLRVVEVDQDLTDIASLTFDGGSLRRSGNDTRVVRVRNFAAPPADLRPFDPLLGREEPVDLPRAWYDGGGGNMPSLVVGDVRARPLRGGGVRLLRDGQIFDRPPDAARPDRWRIAPIGREALGYGTGGVYRLDEEFRPAERIAAVPFDDERDREGMAYALAGDGETMAVLVGIPSRTTFQVRSRDGARLIREEPVRATPRAFEEPYLLRPLGDGYLLSAGELLWLPKGEGGRPWRFDVRLDPEAGPSRPDFGTDAASFGLARVVGDRLVVAARGGGLYIFSVAAVTGGPKPPG